MAVAIILYLGGGMALRGLVTVGTAIAFIQYSQRFFRPIQDLSDKYNLLQAAMASSERIFKLLDTPVTITDPQPAPMSVVRGPSSVVTSPVVGTPCAAPNRLTTDNRPRTTDHGRRTSLPAG